MIHMLPSARTSSSEHVVYSTVSYYDLQLVIRLARGARSARADARLCTSSGINLIVPLSFHLVR